MGIHLSEVFGNHSAALRLRVERSQVLAANLANETTPGYQARDFDFATAMRDARRDDAALLNDERPPLGYRVPYQPSTDGNTVELGVEQAAFAQNAIDYQAGLTFLDAELKELNMAISGNPTA